MKKGKISLAGIILCLLLGSATSSYAQKGLKYQDFKGIKFLHENEETGTSTKLQFNARFQSRFDLSSEGNDDLSPSEALFRIRRMRLKAKGHLIDPKLTFKIELAFSRNDLSEQLEKSGNILYDAYLQYALSPALSVRFGQFKVPGNRERVVSSGDLSFVDRSILNSAYNLDRDIGAMLTYEKALGSMIFGYQAMVSNGEGRNILSTDVPLNDNNELDLAFTQRVEFLPFGAFEGGGDYFEADLLREETPKLSVGGGYSHNNDAVRARGQRSSLLYGTRDINTSFIDMIFKYQGWHLMGEYMKVDTDERPITDAPLGKDFGKQRAVRTGDGFMAQGGYVWPSLWGINARYSKTSPGLEVYELSESFYNLETEARLGVSRFIRGHRIKVQSDIGYLTKQKFSSDEQGFWEWRFQVEMGF